MKQPSAAAYLFGNPFLFFILGIMTLIVGIMAFTTQGFAVPAIIMLGVMGYATNCSRQVLAYKKWQREWDTMSGQPPKPPFRMNLSWLRYPVGIGLWLLAAGLYRLYAGCRSSTLAGYFLDWFVAGWRRTGD